MHEFIHALGMYHVQSRTDRDKYVEIKWDNIPEDAKHNFKIKKTTRTFDVPYDPLSIMHYPNYAFAKDSSKPTIVSKVTDWICHTASTYLCISKVIFVNRLHQCQLRNLEQQPN